MNAKPVWICAAAAAIVVAAAFQASGVEVDSLRRKQDAQQRARAMTRELISSVLDIQLEQLEENGLQELPLYRDIQTMRTNIDTLVQGEMQKVVTILEEARHD
ncbi:MAG TPA: hypothetical protein VHB77_15435, partial [Planctomycetaceae bacterium]|nr:hypothetical protein [Planctomycetaceae bacterium]